MGSVSAAVTPRDSPSPTFSLPPRPFSRSLLRRCDAPPWPWPHSPPRAPAPRQPRPFFELRASTLSPAHGHPCPAHFREPETPLPVSPGLDGLVGANLCAARQF